MLNPQTFGRNANTAMGPPLIIALKQGITNNALFAQVPPMHPTSE